MIVNRLIRPLSALVLAVAMLGVVTGCPSDPSLEIQTLALQDTTNGAAYSVTITAGGGRSANYTWSISSGSLPGGLSLTSGTPDATISGTVADFAGRYEFTVRVDGDAGDVDTKTYTILVDQRRWVVFRGDTWADGLNELNGVDVSGTIDGAGFISTGGFVTSSGHDQHFSPDGDWVAWLEFYKGDPELFLADMRGQQPINYQRISGNSPTGVLGFQWSPDSQSIAYISDATTSGRFELYLSARGSSSFGAPQRVAAMPSGRDVVDFAFSPDGTKLGWIADMDSDDRHEVWVTDITGGSIGTTVKVMSVVSGGDVLSLLFSPDSTLLAFVGDCQTNDRDELFLANLSAFPTITSQVVSGSMTSGGDVRNVAEDSYDFAPDTSGLAYIADQNVDERYELFRVQLVAGVPQPAQQVSGSMVSNGDVHSFLWSPDGTDLLYNADQDIDGENELFLVDVSGASPGADDQVNQALGSGRSIPAQNEFTGYAFSPDGTWVAFRADDSALGLYELWLTDRATLTTPVRVNKQLVNSAQDVRSFVWSPDSVWLLYDADEDAVGRFELFRVSATNPGVSEQVSGAMISAGDADSAGKDTGFAYSTDGSFVIYVADANVDGRVELFYVDLASPGVDTRLNNRLPFDGDVYAFESER